jgi:SSS family solute:Na+ symporter
MLTSLDIGIMAVFLVGSVGLGLWFAARWRGSEGFFLAGRELTWPLIGLSLFATNISAEHFVGLAAGGYSHGLVSGGWEWMASYCLLVLALVFAPQYLRQKVYTIPEFFERRYGVEARVGLALYFLAMIVLTKTAVALYAGSKVVHFFLAADLPSISLSSVIWTIGILTALYTCFGGLSAVIYTDFVQAIVLLVGAVVLTWAALDRVGGWDGLVLGLEARGASAKLSMVRGPTDPDLPFSGYILGNFLIGGMFYWCMDQVNVQRVLGARDTDQAQKGAIFAGFLKIAPVFVMVLPGLIASTLDLGIEEANDAYAVLVQNLLGSGMRGLVLAALFAAMMSSLSSAFNSAATIGGRDFVARFSPTASVKAQIRVGQIFLTVVALSGIWVAQSGIIDRYKNLWDYLQEVTGYLSAPFAAAGLLGVFSRRVNREGALVGIITSIAVGALLFVDAHPELFTDDVPAGSKLWFTHELLASMLHRVFLTAAVGGSAMWIVSLLTAPPPREVLDGEFWIFRRRSGAIGDAATSFATKFWAASLFVIVTALWWIFR